MYELTTQELSIFVVLGFCAGVFTSFYLTRMFEVVHMWRMFRTVLAHLLLMCVGIMEDVAFLKEVRRKQMVEAEYTPTQVRNFQEFDEQVLTNWKQSVILSLVTKAPRPFKSMMPFTTWEEAVHFLNNELKSLSGREE